MSRTITNYLRIIDSTPLLTQDEEVNYILTAKFNPISKEKLFKSHLVMIVGQAKKSYKQVCNEVPVTLEDLIQEGLLGLERALDKFDVRKNFRFSTYARWWVRARIKRCIQNASLIRLPDQVYLRINKKRQADEALERKLERLPTEDELADDLDSEVADIVFLNAVSGRSMPPLPCDQSDTHQNHIPDDAIDPSEFCIQEDSISILRKAIGKLNPNCQYIIKHRYGIDCDEETLHKIGRELNLSFERIRQLQVVAEKQLKKALRDDKQYDYQRL